jgi:predicted transposase/invertase (TIGR01784 family)
LSNIIEVSFLELKKVKEIKSNDMKYLWAIFLSTQSEEVLDMLSETNPTLNKAVEKLKYVSADEQVSLEYNQRQLARMDYYSDLVNSRDEGLKEGIKKGEMNLAKKLLAQGVAPEIIAEVTGKSIESINKYEN